MKYQQISNIINDNIFKIYNLSFTYNEIIQCCCLMSYHLYDYIHNDNCNGLIFIFDKVEQSVIILPSSYDVISYNKYYHLYNIDDVTPNTYWIDNDNNTVLFITKGYIYDHYKIKNGHFNHKVHKDIDMVKITSKDIEKVTTNDTFIV